MYYRSRNKTRIIFLGPTYSTPFHPDVLETEDLSNNHNLDNCQYDGGPVRRAGEWGNSPCHMVIFIGFDPCPYYVHTNIYIYGGFLQWGYPQLIHFNRIFHYEPDILGNPIYENPHMYVNICILNGDYYTLICIEKGITLPIAGGLSWLSHFPRCEPWCWKIYPLVNIQKTTGWGPPVIRCYKFVYNPI